MPEEERRDPSEEIQTAVAERVEQQPTGPIVEDETSVSYLGVKLEKSQVDSQFVPDRKHYKDYISDQYALELQQKFAVSFIQNEPLLLEGGTSIGKTTTARKMASELGWEVHYINLNGASDVEDLMGRYIPNPHASPESPEYIFADGKVTSGLRVEEGKRKLVILDELNACKPDILIRLHEVLDALERDGTVTLSEDASESVPVSKDQTKIVGLMNPPGKGFIGREPLDPAQLRRWNYQKEASTLPDQTFSYSADVLFGLAKELDQNAVPQESYLVSRDSIMPVEQLKEIPGIAEVLSKYKEFHKGAKELVANRQIGADQPQKFTYDDRMEPRRVKEFVQQFYKGDINETFQRALRYYYSNKLESRADKQKLEELINHVAYVPQESTKRRGADRESPEPVVANKASSEVSDDEASALLLKAFGGESREPIAVGEELSAQILEAREVLGKENVIGPAEISEIFNLSLNAEDLSSIPFSEKELEAAAKLGQFLIYRPTAEKNGRPLTMKVLHDKVEPSFDRDKEGKVLYDTSWYENERFFTEQVARGGWALVSAELVPNSTDKNYLDQTKVLADYARGVAKDIPDGSLQREYAAMIKEFNDKEPEIRRLLESDWQEAAKQLAELKINRELRQRPVEAFIDTVAHYKNGGGRILEDKYTWTNQRDSDGGLVDVGGSDPEGLGVYRDDPGFAGGSLGVSFSRNL